MSDRKVTLEVTGHPVAKGRGRAVNTPNGPRIYTPGKTAKWEQDARLVARQAMEGRAPFDGPVLLTVDAVFSPAASWPKWRREAALAHGIQHTMKPDVDNLAKAALDAINGIVFQDDRQVFSLVVRKGFAEAPCVTIEAREVREVKTAKDWTNWH